MASQWKQATKDLACAREGCRGIEAGEFYFQRPDGSAIHGIGACRNSDGKILPAFPWSDAATTAVKSPS